MIRVFMYVDVYIYIHVYDIYKYNDGYSIVVFLV